MSFVMFSYMNYTNVESSNFPHIINFFKNKSHDYKSNSMSL